ETAKRWRCAARLPNSFQNPKVPLGGAIRWANCLQCINWRPQWARATVPRASDQLTYSSLQLARQSTNKVRPMTQSAEDSARAILRIFSLRRTSGQVTP